MKNFKYLVVLAILAFVASCSDSDNDAGLPDIKQLPKKDMRAIWLSTAWGIDWPVKEYDAAKQKELYLKYLDIMEEYNFNTIFAQIRPSGDAFYDSPYEPWSSNITGTQGQDPGYDVLAFMLEEAHKRDIEFHAWLNPYRISTRAKSDVPYPALDGKINAEWVKDYDLLRMYNPALPEVQNHIVDIVKDIISKYDVDGIHFDDYFYPSPEQVGGVKDVIEYEMYKEENQTIEDFRRANVNTVIRRVNELIKSTKPGCAFSVSPASDNDYNFNSLYADVFHWCQQGWVDVVIPQLYNPSGSGKTSFNYRLDRWSQFAYQAKLMVGYGIYKFGDVANGSKYLTSAELATQFKYAKLKPKVCGSIMYRGGTLFDNPVNIMEVIGEEFKDPAVRPFLGKGSLPQPQASVVTLSGSTLSWKAQEGITYGVYYDKKGSSIRLLSLTKTGTYTMTEKGDYFVTAINKDNFESGISNIVSH